MQKYKCNQLQHLRMCSHVHRVTGLLHANFLLEENPAQCPHKHDLKLTVPNEFSGLAEDTLVVSVVRCNLHVVVYSIPSLICILAWACTSHEMPCACLSLLINLLDLMSTASILCKHLCLPYGAQLFIMHLRWQKQSSSMPASCRNVLDWTTSLFNKPWHAQNHCNISFSEFLVREWSLGDFAQEPHLMPPCPKYVVGMRPYYEVSTQGEHPRDVLELRSWKVLSADT